MSWYRLLLKVLHIAILFPSIDPPFIRTFIRERDRFLLHLTNPPPPISLFDLFLALSNLYQRDSIYILTIPCSAPSRRPRHEATPHRFFARTSVPPPPPLYQIRKGLARLARSTPRPLHNMAGRRMTVVALVSPARWPCDASASRSTLHLSASCVVRVVVPDYAAIPRRWARPTSRG